MRRRWSPATGPAPIIVSLLVVVACWLVVVPPGAGADEGNHLVRAGAVVRGEWSGTDAGIESRESHVLPDSYLLPETCYAFQSDVPVSCAAPVVRTGAEVVLTTRADEYQVWPHLVYGLPTLLPGPPAVWWARAIGGAIVVALVGAALLVSRTEQARAGILVASTPMALGTFATVNPSTFTIAGAIALWAAARREGPPDRIVGWTLAAGWAAMALSRRDGLVWAVVTIVVLQVAMDRSSVDRWWRLGRGPQILIGASTLSTVLWGLTNESSVSRLVALSPLALVAGELLHRSWHRRPLPMQRAVLVGGTATAFAAATAAALARRPGGWDAQLARAVIDQTGTHLVEAIGVLGWLDTPMPWFVIAGWVATVGVLAAGALVEESRTPLVATAVVALAVTSAWLLELLHGNTSGRYWQGRYSLPLLVGVPIVLGAAVRSRAVGRVAGVSALVLLNAALWASARRWGVGLQGSLVPWDWNTPHTPFPTLSVLVVHAVATVGLAIALATRPAVSPSA